MVSCQYCGSAAQLVMGDKIYPHRKDLFNLKFWYCDNEHEPAYVGCHRGGKKPLGTLANAELRRWKSAAHKAFDPLWNRGRKSPKKSRASAYAWLSKVMELDAKDTHIGMFSVEQCKQVIRESGRLLDEHGG